MENTEGWKVGILSSLFLRGGTAEQKNKEYRFKKLATLVNLKKQKPIFRTFGLSDFRTFRLPYFRSFTKPLN